MTGSKPYKELSDTEIIRAYKEGNYPSLVSLAAFNDTIHKCWAQCYASVEELLEDVKAEGMNFQLLRCSTRMFLVTTNFPKRSGSYHQSLFNCRALLII